MLITAASALGVSFAGFDLDSASQFMPLVLMLVVFYFLLIRPQQQKAKDLRQTLAALKRGDRVVTGGGMLSTVQRVAQVPDEKGNLVAGSEVEVDIAPNIRVTVLRETITSVVRPEAANDAKPAGKAKSAS